VIFIPVERYFYFKKIPVVNMVQNMEPLAGGDGGNPVFERVQHWFRAYLAKKGIRKADRVIAISNFVKEYLKDSCGVPDDKIGLIYYGMNNPENCRARRPSILPLDWEEDFIFTAGSIRPTRGLEDIFLAMHYLIKGKEELPSLVVAGEPNPNMAGYQNKLKKWVKQLGIADKVCWANHLDDSEMAWCYKNSKLFIMSSRVESFGQIALEAMSHGCPCISADNPCLPEIFKDAAMYYPPRDGQSLAKNIRSVLSWDTGQREEAASRSRNRANMFSWDVCVSKTVSELVKAVKNSRIENVK
jgi:glycosyltransferase involved in cell wall biosynthesis